MPEAERKDAKLGEVTARALIDGVWRESGLKMLVRDPYRGEVIGEVASSTAADLDAAIEAAVVAKPKAAAMAATKRAAVLRSAALLLEERASEIGMLMARETGKAVKDATGEVRRSQDTLLLSAEEAIRIEGAHVPLDGSDLGAGKIAFLLRFPVGVVGAITPFNAPVNLACHKIGPAIAAGNTVVLKASPQASLVVHKLVEIFADVGLPPGYLNAVYGNSALGAALVRDPRVDFITFTGSSKVGLDIKANSGLKRVALELGGNGSTIVHSDADCTEAAKACAVNATRLAGQSCISVQNAYVHRSIYQPFVDAMAAHMRTLRVGDPLDAATDIGTLINEAAARRVKSCIDDAVAGGARVVTGGKRNGAQIEPTLLVDVVPTMKVVCEEVFGPVASVIPYDDINQVFVALSASEYGLQCGIYTRSNEITFRAIRALRTGGVIVNGTSTWRTDQLAYGGVKASGFGREGPRYAIRDMTDERLVVFNL